MKHFSSFSRRQFLGITAAAAGAAPFLTRAAESSRGQPGTIQLSSVSWNFHGLGPGADPEAAIDTIGGLGFDGIELIANSGGDFKTFWTDDRVDRLRRKLEQNKLRVPQFAMFQPVVENLSSSRRDEREQALDHFESGCRLASRFNAPIVNIVAPWARELEGPTSYLPRYYEVASGAPQTKFHIDIADGFDWDLVWNGFVETVKACVARAKAHGLKFTIENHTHTLLPDTGSMLRLWDAIRDPALGFNLDAGWIQLNREYAPLAIHKLKGHLLHLHLRDIDGLMRSFSPIGLGVMDFPAIAQALRQTGYQGFASLEQDGHPRDPDMRDTCRRYLETLRACLEAAG
ncbi:MAG TPA: sugar phosphate isomerase/epimerase [Candidatus Paceibacterota bacterium]|nr:sugar phosphate isomerase/epimerase [Candidatus Paceibacterota bacterium]